MGDTLDSALIASGPTEVEAIAAASAKILEFSQALEGLATSYIDPSEVEL